MKIKFITKEKIANEIISKKIKYRKKKKKIKKINNNSHTNEKKKKNGQYHSSNILLHLNLCHGYQRYTLNAQTPNKHHSNREISENLKEK